MDTTRTTHHSSCRLRRLPPWIRSWPLHGHPQPQSLTTMPDSLRRRKSSQRCYSWIMHKSSQLFTRWLTFRGNRTDPSGSFAPWGSDTRILFRHIRVVRVAILRPRPTSRTASICDRNCHLSCTAIRNLARHARLGGPQRPMFSSSRPILFPPALKIERYSYVLEWTHFES
ncbi:hypothetical protein FA13DRAFT_362744 [Coprinellus micaceus]|uniref:Uncharacterized protein n=1 Tax=Coprinellus micaceus TaxID=71717 RepID=A0A4Y7TBI5_COPMI|nr:hypothetical protein FA13DRAFT_362744 [Coprinellus micaceus]